MTRRTILALAFPLLSSACAAPRLLAAVEVGDAAAYWGHRTAAELLLSRGADPSATNAAGQTPLHRALFPVASALEPGGRAPAPGVLVRATETVALLLDRGADPNAATAAGDLPLQLAVASGHRPLVDLLLARGASFDAPAREGVTPLYVAVQVGNADLAEALLALGARVDARTRSGYTPLSYAARTGQLALAALLVARGADVDAADVHGETPLRAALSAAALVSPAGQRLLASRGVSARQLAEIRRDARRVEGRWRDVALLLAQHGANVVAHPPEAPSSLFFAAAVGDERLVAALADRGAPLDEITTGETALHCAIAEGHTGVAALLLERGARADVVNMSRRTPLHFAARFTDDVALVERLLARGADGGPFTPG